MNRAERRRQAKMQSKGEKTINIKAYDIESIKQSATRQAANKAFVMMLSIPLMVLRDKYGFGKKTVRKIH